MKDFEKRFKLLCTVRDRLARDFGVEKPKLLAKNLKGIHGYYIFNKIIINLDTLHNNLSRAVETVRHEFCHYLMDFLVLDDRRSELKAKRFERNMLALGVLPINQRLLTNFAVNPDCSKET